MCPFLTWDDTEVIVRKINLTVFTVLITNLELKMKTAAKIHKSHGTYGIAFNILSADTVTVTVSLSMFTQEICLIPTDLKYFRVRKVLWTYQRLAPKQAMCYD